MLPNVTELTWKNANKLRDEPDLALSAEQKHVFAGWKRPDEIFTGAMSDSPSTTPGPTMVGSEVVDLVQDITTDCSVVASLCAATARAERGHHPVRQIPMPNPS
jgi:hypothetical protein